MSNLDKPVTLRNRYNVVKTWSGGTGIVAKCQLPWPNPLTSFKFPVGSSVHFFCPVEVQIKLEVPEDVMVEDDGLTSYQLAAGLGNSSSDDLLLPEAELEDKALKI
jgi:hypothetical protein